jgi:pimeloyl-ACP methyl ester carboxylesterase
MIHIPREDMSLPQAVCNGIQISFDDTEVGSNKVPLIFLHGHGLNRSMWDYQKQAFRGSHRVVTYDLRGHGRSEKPGTGYGQEEEIKDLNDLLGVLRAPKAHLIGLSRGAGIALGFAASHPEKTTSVIAMGAGYDFGRVAPDFAEQRTQTVSILRAEGLRAAKEHWLSLPIFGPAMENEDVATRVDHLMLSYTGAHWLDETPPQNGSLADVVSAITAKTLILVGERDLAGFQTCADELAGKISGAEKREIPGAGHLLNLEAPEAVTEAITGFLASGSASA